MRWNSSSTFHDQIGYGLWESATGTVIQSLTIPRRLTAMAFGKAAADTRVFELRADYGSPHFGICSSPYLDDAFKTLGYRGGLPSMPTGPGRTNKTPC